MRIALVPSADLGYESGSVILAKRLFRFLIGCGHQVYLLGSRRPPDFSQELARFVSIDQRILEHPVIDDRAVSDGEYLDSLSSTLTFLAALHREKPLDVVHVQYASFTSLAASMFEAVTGVPFVISSFGRDFFLGFPSDERLQRMIERSVPSAAAVIVANESTRTRIEGIFGSRAPMLLEIPVPIDEDFLAAPSSPAPRDGPPLVVSVNSCFSPEKGIELLLRGIAGIAAGVPGLRLTLAGTDDHPERVHERSVRALVSRSSLEDQVEFAGYLGRQDVRKLMDRAQVLVDARTTPNFSSVSLEAQFAGCPVLCARNSGGSQIVTDGRNGLLFDSGDPADLGRKLLLVLASAELRERLRAGCGEWVSANGRAYRESTCFDRTLQVYQSLARKSHDENRLA